jgi:hypothetical protein
MYKLFQKCMRVDQEADVSRQKVRWISDLRTWLEDVPITGTVSLYGDSLSQAGIERRPSQVSK